MRDTLAPDAPYIHWKHLLAKLDESVKAYCSAKVVSIEDNGIRITDVSGKELLLPADNVLIATGMRATGPRYDGRTSLVDDIRIVGDCQQAGKISMAMRTGYCAGASV